MNSTEQEEPQGPVTVQVTVGGAYQVTVFPIREGMGILESNVVHTEEIAVDIAVYSTGLCMYGAWYSKSCAIMYYKNKSTSEELSTVMNN